jgi:integrase/recombinase XerD
MKRTSSTWHIDQTRILTADEIARVLADLQRRARRSVTSRANLILFRLATCCALRASELIGLRVGDVRVAGDRPHIAIPKTLGKGKKARKVPLWWDAGTLADIASWRDFRVSQGAGPADPFLCSQDARAVGKPLDRFSARARFRTACRGLGRERVSELSTHAGRHSGITHWLRGGRSLPEVRDAAGHANISTTSLYLHAVPDDGRVGSIFGAGT